MDGPLDGAKGLLSRWIDAWKHGAQRGESTSRLAHASEAFINKPGLVMWGSDCTDCGNATFGSMVCDSCGSNRHTVCLWKEEATLIDREAFKAAVAAAAFETNDDRRIVHSTTGPPLMVGADWELQDVLYAIDDARDVRWSVHALQPDHGLRVTLKDGKVRFFQVPEPQNN